VCVLTAHELRNVVFIQYITTIAKLHFIKVPNIHFYRVLKYKEKYFVRIRIPYMNMVLLSSQGSLHQWVCRIRGTPILNTICPCRKLMLYRQVTGVHMTKISCSTPVRTTNFCLPVSTLISDNHNFKNVRGNGASNSVPSLIILATGILLTTLL